MSMELTLGPVLFNWKPDAWRDFYYRIADEAPVDTVVLGEIVCSKRMPFLLPVLPAVIERLMGAGKTVILGSLITVSLERERRQMEELAQSSGFLVEANDLSIMPHLAGRSHALGPFINVYNETTARYLAERGAVRICLPPELPRRSIAVIAKSLPGITIEVFAFGRIPLAISARCYHARLHKLTKDNCRFVCENDPDGCGVETLDGEPFLVINGVQTLSYTCANLLPDASTMADLGVRSLRLSPQDCDMVAVANIFRSVLDGGKGADDGEAELGRVYPGVALSNGFFRGQPGVTYSRSPTSG